MNYHLVTGMPEMARSGDHTDNPKIKEGRPDTCQSDWDAVFLGKYYCTTSYQIYLNV